LVEMAENKKKFSAEELPQLTLQSLEKVVRKVNLENIVLLDFDAERIFEDDEFDNYRLQSKVGIEIIELKPLQKLFYVIYRLGTRAISQDKDGDDDNPLFRIEASLRLTYSLSSRRGITKKDIAVFGYLNSIIHAWPYWREFVNNQTLRLGVPTIIIKVKPAPVILDRLSTKAKELFT